jgi:hypothetical protein
MALSMALVFGCASSTQSSRKDENLFPTLASSRRMADGKEWTTANLNVNTSSSYVDVQGKRHPLIVQRK